MSCTECNASLPAKSEACPECGYPVSIGSTGELPDEIAALHGNMKEYRLIQLLGAIVVGVGIAAVLADSPIAAAVAITIGIGTYGVGLLGAWWNTGD